MKFVAMGRLLALLSVGLPFSLAAQTSANPDLTTPSGVSTSPASIIPDHQDKVITLEAFEVSEMKSFSDQAIPGKTPVAYTEFGKDQIAEELGSRDIPAILASSPSVYTTPTGGGAGDSRLNVRGFDQRNISILINGVPTNDMENGWLYWSNWDGLGDVSSTIQVQRGLSAVTLPTPSVGGTMNIITDPAASEMGGSFKSEVGSDGFLKGTLVLNSGLLNNKVALTLGMVAKTGDGYVRGTWTEGYGYYLGSVWKVNARNRLELFAIGAPQEHGQRSFASNIAAYDVGFAKSLGYTNDQLYKITYRSNGSVDYTNSGALAQGPVGDGRDFNPNYAPVSPSYTGQQYWNGAVHSRKDSGFINERENYFHKPQINLNWYLTLSDELKLTTVVYFSGGVGGGSGTLYNGSTSAAFGYFPNTDPAYGSAIDWNKTIASNAGTVDNTGKAKAAGQSLGALRNSVNVQSEVGGVSKLTYTLASGLKLNAGVDWRTYQADHYQEIRDLLGGSYYLASATQANAFWANGTNTQLHLGDKVGYYYHSTVDWLGGFVQGQYDRGPIHTFAVYGYTATDYGYTDQFHKNTSGSPIKLKSSNLTGQQMKGGLSYSLTDQFSLFGNAGWVSRAPVFTTVVDTYNSKLADKADNESFKSAEFGARWKSADGKLDLHANYYATQWRNRSSVSSSANTVTYRRGINADYSGFEFEGSYKPVRWLRFDGAASIADWTYADNGNFVTISDSTHAVTGSGTLYIKSLKVGASPQTQYAASATVYPVKGLSIKLMDRTYQRYWSDYDPTSRSSSSDLGQPWQIPSYSIFDLHVNYRVPIHSDQFEVMTFLHIFNVFDKVYIADATDNSQYEAVGLGLAPSHSAQRAEVFFGLPRAFNAGVKVAF